MYRRYYDRAEREAYHELLKVRKRAHEVFDSLWLSERITRKEAYLLMEELLQLKPGEAHIALLSAKQCRRLIERIESGRFKTGHLREKAKKRRRWYDAEACRLELLPRTNG